MNKNCSFKAILYNIPHINEEQPKDVNVQPVGFGNTKISTD